MEALKQCNYCNRTVTKLTALSCNHQVCSNCVLKLCLFNYHSHLLEYKEDVTLTCLQCQNGELKITRKALYKIFLEINALDYENKPHCKVHNIKEDVNCKECEIPMCPECFEAHLLSPLFSNHQSINHHICSEHKLNLLYQCRNCDIPLCEECKSTDHKDHSMEIIKDFFKKKREDLLKEIRLPFETFEEYDKYLTKEDEAIKKEIKMKSWMAVYYIEKAIEHLIQKKEDVKNNEQKLTDNITINSKINRVIYKNLYKELETLSREDYFKINILSKLPKHYNFYQVIVEDNELMTKGLREMNEMVDKLNRKKGDHLKLEAKRIFDKNITTIKVLNGHIDKVNCLIQLEDGKLASGSSDTTIRLWDPMNDYNCIKTLVGHTKNVQCLIQLEDGKLASGSWDNIIRLWDPMNDYNCIKTLVGHTESVKCLVQLEDGKLASGSSDFTIRVWDLKSSKCVKILIEHTRYVYCLIKLEDGILASASWDKTIRVWDLKKDFKCIKTIIRAHTKEINSLIQLNDGKIASCSYDMTIRVWDSKNEYKCIKTLTEHTNDVYCLLLLKDGTFASYSWDNTIRQWDPQNDYKCINTILWFNNHINCLIQLKDEIFASCSNETTIRLWKINQNFN